MGRSGSDAITPIESSSTCALTCAWGRDRLICAGYRVAEMARGVARGMAEGVGYITLLNVTKFSTALQCEMTGPSRNLNYKKLYERGEGPSGGNS